MKSLSNVEHLHLNDRLQLMNFSTCNVLLTIRLRMNIYIHVSAMCKPVFDRSADLGNLAKVFEIHLTHATGCLHMQLICPLQERQHSLGV